MKNRSKLGLIAAGWLVAFTAVAHHSTAFNYNRDSIISVEGIVTEYKFQHPHVQVSLDVETEAGETVVWLVELAAKNQYLRMGWTGDEFQAGQMIKVSAWEGYRPRTAYMRTAIMPDGNEINTAPNLPGR